MAIIRKLKRLKISLHILPYFISFIIFIFTSGSYDFYSDEFYHLSAAKGLVETGTPYSWNFWTDKAMHTHTDGYTRGLTFTYIVAAVGKLTGSWSETILRIIPWLFGVLTIFIVHFTLVNFYSEGLFCFFLVSIFSVSQILMHQYLRMYTLLGFTVVSGFMLSLWILKKKIKIILFFNKKNIWKLLLLFITIFFYYKSYVEEWQFLQIPILLFNIFLGLVLHFHPKFFINKKVMFIFIMIYIFILIGMNYLLDLLKPGQLDFFQKQFFLNSMSIYNKIALIRAIPVFIPILIIGAISILNYIFIRTKDKFQLIKGYLLHIGFFGTFIFFLFTLYLLNGPVAFDFRYQYIPLLLMIIGFCGSFPNIFNKSFLVLKRINIVWLVSIITIIFIFIQINVTRWTLSVERSHLRNWFFPNISKFKNTTILTYYGRLGFLYRKNYGDINKMQLQQKEIRHFPKAKDGNLAGSGSRFWTQKEIIDFITSETVLDRRVFFLMNYVPCCTWDEDEFKNIYFKAMIGKIHAFKLLQAPKVIQPFLNNYLKVITGCEQFYKLSDM